VSVVLWPVMPQKMEEMRAVLSLDKSTLNLDNARVFFDLQPGTEVRVVNPVFPRLKESVQRRSKPKAKTETGTIDISEFARADMRVAEVLEAERVEGADRLLKLKIDLGSEQRQIVAGVAEQYPPEQIRGMKIIVVTNLKPATIRGIESRGMLLAAKSGKRLVLLTLDGDLPPGASVS